MRLIGLKLASVKTKNTKQGDSMEERRKDYPALIRDIEEIKEDVSAIKHIINGNGKKGMAAKVEDHEEYIGQQKKQNSDMFTTVYRTALGLGVAYICYKLGVTVP